MIDIYNFYRKIYKLNCVSLRYSNIYGPRQNSKSEADVIAILCDKLLKNKIPIFFGSGTYIRDFLFVDDTVNSALISLNLKIQKDFIFNIGTGIEILIKKIYKLISKQLKILVSPKSVLKKKKEI